MIGKRCSQVNGEGSTSRSEVRRSTWRSGGQEVGDINIFASFSRRGTRRVVEKSSIGREEGDGWCVDKKPSLGGKKEAKKEMIGVSQNILITISTLAHYKLLRFHVALSVVFGKFL